MKLLLDEQYAPVTNRFEFIPMPPEQIADALIKGILGHEHPSRILGQSFTTETVSGSFTELLDRLTDFGLTREASRFLLIECGEQTAIFTNRMGLTYMPQQGVCPWNLIPHGLGNHDFIACAMNPALSVKKNPAGERDGHLAFGRCANTPEGELIYQTVRLFDSADGWIYDADGPLFPGETEETRRARRKTSRLTIPMLVEWLHYFGLDALNPDFYGARAVMITEDSLPAGTYKFGQKTLTQFQKDWCIVPGHVANLP